MMVWKILNSILYVDMGSGMVSSLRKNSFVFFTLMDYNSHFIPIINNQVRYVTLIIILRLYQVIQYAVPIILEDLTLNGKQSNRFIMRNYIHRGIEMLQEHQQRSLLRDLRVSINIAILMVMWRDPTIWAQPDISNICYVDFLAPIFSKVDVHLRTSL